LDAESGYSEKHKKNDYAQIQIHAAAEDQSAARFQNEEEDIGHRIYINEEEDTGNLVRAPLDPNFESDK
jgi:hypothetical protein